MDGAASPLTPPLPAVYLGLGGGAPGVAGVAPDGAVSPAAAGQPGESVYGVALSPAGGRLVSGARNKRAGDQHGRVAVWQRRPDGGLDRAPLAWWYQPGAVTAVAMASEEVALSGGVDGVIHAWSPACPDRELACVRAHAGAVLGLECLSPQVAASVGGDGRLCIWDLDTLQLAHSVPDVAPPVVQGLVRVAHAAELGLVVSHHPSGSVLVHELGAGVISRQLALPGGPVAAVALAGDRLVTVDLHSPLTLRVVDLADGAEQSSARCDAPVLAIVPVAADRVVVIGRDGSATVWRVAPALAPERRLAVADVRCGTGPPRPFQLRQAEEASAAGRQAMLARVRAAVESGGVQAVLPEMDALAAGGMGVEGLVLLAEASLREGRPVWALRARLALARELPPEPWSARHLYALADLLEELGEPVRARMCFERALECDPDLAADADFADVAQRIERLLPAGELSPDGPEVVRDDFGEGLDPAAVQAAILEEVEKCAALGVAWVWPIAIRLGRPVALRASRLDLASIHQNLHDASWRVAQVPVRERPGEAVRRSWLVLDGAEALGVDVGYAVEIREVQGQAHLLHRIALAPPSETDPEEAAFEVAESLSRLGAAEVATWVETVGKRVNLAANVEAAATAAAEGGLFTRRRPKPRE